VRNPNFAPIVRHGLITALGLVLVACSPETPAQAPTFKPITPTSPVGLSIPTAVQSRTFESLRPTRTAVLHTPTPTQTPLPNTVRVRVEYYPAFGENDDRLGTIYGYRSSVITTTLNADRCGGLTYVEVRDSFSGSTKYDDVIEVANDIDLGGYGYCE
jgi:hypothetical protein